jgi:hypothetical protein
LSNGNILYRLAFWMSYSPSVFNLCDNIHAFYDVAKNDMFSIEMRRAVLSSNDEELAAVCILISSVLC